jgi:circadian clock protein KaiB
MTGNNPLTTKTQRKLPAPKWDLAAKFEGRYALQLFVAGATARSRAALRHVYQLCEAQQKDNYDLEVVDVYQQPELARDKQIVATPTLLRSQPMPVRRFIGNLSNTAGLFADPELSA